MGGPRPRDVDALRAPVSDEDVLVVARAHGTRVAADWSGWGRETVVALRKRVDGYDRGRGHPSKAEIAAQAPSLACRCRRCLDWRSEEATRSNARWDHYWGPLAGPDPVWRERARCRGGQVDPQVFFPTGPSGTWPGPKSRHLYEPAKAVCATCPVADECLEFALANNIEHGVYGGLDPHERHDHQRRQTRRPGRQRFSA